MGKGFSALILVCLITGPAIAGEDATGVMETVVGTVGIQQQTQRLEDVWADEKSALEARYRALKRSHRELTDATARLAMEIEGREHRVAELEERLVESDRVDEELLASLDNVIDRLTAWTTEDLPFLPLERAKRLESLREIVAGNDSPAEKLRRLLEALQIEMDYGGNVEVYQDHVDIAGESLLVDILRIGRLCLFCRTPDGGLIGAIDRASGDWIEIPGRYARSITKAMEMANRRRPVDLARLPVGRITP